MSEGLVHITILLKILHIGLIFLYIQIIRKKSWVILLKQLLFIILLLFSLVIGVNIIIDLLQGLSIYETFNSFKKIKQKMTGEEVILIIFSFLPLVFTKVNRSSINKNNA